MASRLLVFMALGTLIAGTQLACTNDPPPSVSLRETSRDLPAADDPLDLNAAIKRGEVKRDVEPAGPQSPNVPAGLELLVEQVGRAPLPHQSVRLRLTLKNSGKEEVKLLRLLEPAILLAGIKGPRDTAWRLPLESATLGKQVYTIRPRQTTAIGVNRPLSTWIANEHLSLKPGEQITIVGAFGPWRLEDDIFEQPGDYALQLDYLTTGFRLKAKPVTVRVGKPEGDDAEALKLLSSDQSSLNGVIFALRTPNIALDGQLAGRLEKLVQQHPKSSYADYARLALTRSGVDKHLSDVDPQHFALAPDALLRLRTLTKDQAGKDRIDAKLRADFHDSCEWTEFQANELPLTFNEWLNLRKPPAERKPPAKP